MTISWYAIRVSYGRVAKFSAQLMQDGVDHFVPMCSKKVEKGGETVTVVVPAVSNLCFVRSTRSLIDEYLMRMGENRYAHFMWDKATRNPIVVPDKSMEDFIRVCRVMNDDALYLETMSDKLREGQRVRVTDGPFKGVEGKILRIRRSRRVVVELPGLLSVATNYVDPRYLEIL